MVDAATFKSHVAYVMQDDRLMATETPRECIRFSAYLRRGGTKEERAHLVETMLQTLGLNRCADTIVGSALLKGISGGEKKRVSVGIELITDPKLLFLDEPLSGLDSYAAFTLTRALKDLAIAGVPVLCTIHQPSSEIFAMFDDVLILHEGQAVYHGPVVQLAEYFRRWDPCPPNFNPADHVMFLLQRQELENSSVLKEIKEAWLQSDLNQAMVHRIDASRRTPSPMVRNLSNIIDARHPGWCAQLAVLVRREFRSYIRNKGILIARFGMSLFLAGLYTWLFAGSASDGDRQNTEKNCTPEHFDQDGCSTAFQAHFGTIVSLSIAAMMGAAQPILLTFPSERPVFLREYAAKQYGVVPYFISKTLMEMPIVLISQTITFLTAYWIMGLHGNIFLLIAVTWGLGIASSSLALVIGCGVASGEKAIQLAPLALIPQMLFSGLFLPVSKIPESLQWVKYACPLKYAINLATVVEFSYVKENIDDCEEVSPTSICRFARPGDFLRKARIEYQGVYFEDWFFDAAILSGLFVAFRVLATFLLWRKGRYVF